MGVCSSMFSCTYPHPTLIASALTAPNTPFSHTHTVLQPPTQHFALACMLLNTRSLTKHATDIWDLLHDNAPDILFLTETWLSPALAPDIATCIP